MRVSSGMRVSGVRVSSGMRVSGVRVSIVRVSGVRVLVMSLLSVLCVCPSLLGQPVALYHPLPVHSLARPRGTRGDRRCHFLCKERALSCQE